jgi:hypothetical protein
MGVVIESALPYGYGWRSSKRFLMFVAVFSLFTGEPHIFPLPEDSPADFHIRETPIRLPGPDLEGHAGVPPQTSAILHPNRDNGHAHIPRLVRFTLRADHRAFRRQGCE